MRRPPSPRASPRRDATTVDAERTARIRHRLRIVRLLALLDLALLVALIASALAGRRPFVQLLGPLHGSNFLLLLAVAATAALDGLWGWWFPAAIVFSGGPLGALIGDWLIGRRLAMPHAEGAADTATGEEKGERR